MMKTTNKLLAVTTLAFLFCACNDSDNSIFTSEPYNITANLTIEDAWTSSSTSTRSNATRASEDDNIFQIYLFGSNDQSIYNNGGLMTKISNGKTFTNITTPGTYTFYGITNLISGEWTSVDPGVTITTASTFTLKTDDAPRDICLGKQSFTVEAKTHAYSVSITATHIMSQLALTVKSVPSDVTSLTITLPSQANVLDFTGTFSGNTTSQTLTLNRAQAPNEDGTYTWSCQPTIVFPCATGTTSMPLTITWGSATVASKVVSTTSTTCCLSGKNLSLSTTWNEAYRTSATITTSDWSAVEEGTFSW